MDKVPKACGSHNSTTVCYLNVGGGGGGALNLMCLWVMALQLSKTRYFFACLKVFSLADVEENEGHPHRAKRRVSKKKKKKKKKTEHTTQN